MSLVAPHRFSPEQEMVIEWMASPTEERGSIKALSEATGKPDRTIWEWRNDPRYMAEARRRTASALHAATPQVLHVIKERALLGEHKFVLLFLSLVGDAAIVAGANAREVIHTMSTEEAERIIARVTGSNAAQQPTTSLIDSNTQHNNT